MVQVPHPADLKALCLVSKHVSAIATQYLYRDLVLPYSDIDRDWIDLRYLLKSRGLQYVQSLFVDSSNINTYGFCKPLNQLLRKLPLKSLTRFRYGTLGQPTDEGLRYLLQHQDKLTNLQLDFSLMAPTLEELIREEGTAIRSLNCLTELEMILGDETDTSPGKYSELLDMINVTRLKKVTLYANGDWRIFGLENAIERSLKSALPTSLKHLSLTNIPLPELDEQYLQLDKFPSLRHLELHECRSPAFTLDSFRQPMLTSFTIQLCSLWSPGEEDLAAVSRFLRRFGSLSRLIIGNQPVISLDRIVDDLAVSIANHAASLRSLIIFVRCVAISWKSFAEIPLRCKKLCQLVMPARMVDLVRQCQVSLSYL